MKAVFFPHKLDFRRWLQENHTTAAEITIGFHKAQSGKLGMTYSESLEQALCFGWIDGIRHKIDSNRYSNRFTPRRVNSNWSAVNIKKVNILIAQGVMEPAGIAAFERDRSRNQVHELSDEFNLIFRENNVALNFFELQTTNYQFDKIRWVMGARLAVTRQRRFEKLIEACEKEKKI
jgi:uncharacterized protein YdeI (YjbR/CyaY-like superfamily)